MSRRDSRGRGVGDAGTANEAAEAAAEKHLPLIEVLSKGEEQVCPCTADDWACCFCPGLNVLPGRMHSSETFQQSLLQQSQGHLVNVTKLGLCFRPCSGVARQQAAFGKRGGIGRRGRKSCV